MRKLSALVLSLALIFSFAFVANATDDSAPFDNSSFFTYGDYTLHYRRYDSDESKNQILLIHGFCLSTESLDPIAVQYQKAGYDVVTVDVPNFGYSSRETNDTNLLSREQVIGALMEHLGGTWIIGGHSMGGGIAINLACDYPKTVTGLVLFAPQSSSELSCFMGELMSSCLMQRMFDYILSTALKFPFLVKALVAFSFSDVDFAEKYDLSKISDSLYIDGTGAGITIMTSHARGIDTEKLSKLNIPCTIVTAQNDMVAMKINLRKIICGAPEGTAVYELPEGGHMFMEYSPETVSELTLPTIEKCK